jgi:hypothetical protein
MNRNSPRNPRIMALLVAGVVTAVVASLAIAQLLQADDSPRVAPIEADQGRRGDERESRKPDRTKREPRKRRPQRREPSDFTQQPAPEAAPPAPAVPSPAPPPPPADDDGGDDDAGGDD